MLVPRRSFARAAARWSYWFRCASRTARRGSSRNLCGDSLYRARSVSEGSSALAYATGSDALVFKKRCLMKRTFLVLGCVLLALAPLHAVDKLPTEDAYYKILH